MCIVKNDSCFEIYLNQRIGNIKESYELYK